MADDALQQFNALLGIKTPQTKEPQVQPKLETIQRGIADLKKGVGTITKDPLIGLSPKLPAQVTPTPRPTTLRDEGGLRTSPQLTTPEVTKRQTTGQTAVDKQLERLRNAQQEAAQIKTYDEQVADTQQDVAQKQQQAGQQEQQTALNAESDPLIKVEEQEQQTEDVIEPLQGSAFSRGYKQFASIFSSFKDSAFAGQDIKELDRTLQREYGYEQVNDRGRVQYIDNDDRAEINSWLDRTFKEFEGDGETITKLFDAYAKDRGLKNTNVQDWIEYSNKFADQANKLQEKISDGLKSTDIEIFGAARVKEAERTRTPFEELSRNFAANSQEQIKLAVEAGTLGNVTMTEAYKRGQELADNVAANLNFYSEISYNMSMKRNNKMFNGELATQASERERKTQALIYEIAKREAQVSQDYLDFALQGTKANQIDKLLESKYKAMGYDGINDYINSGARQLAGQIGMSKWYSSDALKRSSGKDTASYFQNLYNLNIESMGRDQALTPAKNFGELLGRDAARAVNWYRTAQNIGQIGLGFTTQTMYNIANQDLRASLGRGFDPIGALGEADLVRLQNVDFTENGVGVWNKWYNSVGGIGKELGGIVLQVIALKSVGGLLPSAPSSFQVSAVTGRSALSRNTMIALSNIGRGIGLSYATDQGINFNSTSKDADIDVFGDMVGGVFEVAGGIKGFFTGQGVFNVSTKGSIFSFSKMIDKYGIEFGTETARRNMAWELIKESPGLTMTEALKRVDEDPVLQREVRERSAYVSETEIRDMIKNVNSLEAAITKFAEADPDGVNAMLKAQYVNSVQQRIQMVAETLGMNTDTPGKIRYLQELQKYVNDPNLNVADLIRVDQKVDATVLFGPYISARAKGAGQAALDFIAKNVEGSYVVNPFVESALQGRIGRPFNVEDIFNIDESGAIVDLIMNRGGGRNTTTILDEAFDSISGGYRLNAQGREWLGIQENLDTAARIARDTDSADSFIENVLREAIQTGEMTEQTLREIQASGAYDRVADIFNKISC